MAKLTEPVNITHYKFSCIGSSNVLRQKNIRKLFANSLAQCQKNAKYTEEVEAVHRKHLTQKDKNATGDSTRIHSANPETRDATSPTSGLNRLEEPHAQTMNSQKSSEFILPTNSHFMKQRLERQKNDETTLKFMKLIDDLQEKKDQKIADGIFRDNYRKRTMNPSQGQYRSSTFIKAPQIGHSKTNLLGSSSAFRQLTA